VLLKKRAARMHPGGIVNRLSCLLLGLLFAAPALAVDKTIVVLPLDVTKTAGKMGPEARASLEEELRDEAANALSGSGWTVMTGETTFKILTDNGIDPSKCGEGSCHLDTAKQMNVEKFISGAVQFFEGAYTGSVRLIDTRSGNILASARIEGKTVHELSRDFAGKAEKFFDRSGLLGESAPPAPSPGPAASAGPQAPATGTLKVVSTPSGAKVSIDGDAAGATPLTLRKDAGTYVISIELSGYAPVSRQVEIASGKMAVVSEALMQAAGYIEISLAPEAAARAASITVDGKPAGPGKQGPYKLGKHAVRAEAPGYRAAEAQAGVDNGGTAQVALTLEALPGKLLISVNVDAQCGAGESTVKAGAEGVTKLEVPAGRARVTCSADGYEDASADVDVGPGRALPVKLGLKRGAGSGQGGADAKTGLRFVAIPGGTFQFQGNREVSIKPFRLGETDVTVAAYAKCVNAGTCSEPKTGGSCNWKTGRDDHPVNCVDWNQATAFCKWIGARLPTEKEWEYVASGGSEGRTYPWGNDEPGARPCWDGEGSDLGKGNRTTTCPVGSHKASDSKWGLHDISGNVWQWTSSNYDSSNKVLRGGSWGDDLPEGLRARIRYRFVPTVQYDNVGLRCGL
jgi:formylglycine-generating enzyme required for sulfatase activity